MTHDKQIPAVKESLTPQPAPGETPESKKAYHEISTKFGETASLSYMYDKARDLEQQRDQAREEIAALKKDCEDIGEKTCGELSCDECNDRYNRLKDELATANADRVRLRGIIEEYQRLIEHADFAHGVTDSSGNDEGNVMANKLIERLEREFKALSTPPPEMVRKGKPLVTTEGLMQAFKAGWKAGSTFHGEFDSPRIQQALREHMAENEPKGKTLAELKGGAE